MEYEIVVLDAATFGEVDCKPWFSTHGSLRVYANTTAVDLYARVRNANIIVSNKVFLSADLLSKCSQLKLICVAATGINNVDMEQARKLTIPVCNVPGYSTDSVVSHTFALYFELAHQLHYHHLYVSEGHWSKSPIFTHLDRPFRSLADKTWGIVGMGAIGQGVAKVAQAFGARVVYASTSGQNLNQPFECVSLDQLCDQTDVVSLHAPLNTQTRHLFDGPRIAQLKDTAILINVARGGLIDTECLLSAINNATIGGAAIDVMDHEPPEPDNVLVRCRSPRLLMTPHIAGLSTDARTKLVEEVSKNIQCFLKQEPRNLV